MKKKYVIVFVMFIVGTVTASAQLKVNCDGDVLIGTKLTLNNISYNAKVESGITGTSGHNVAFLGFSKLQSYNGSQACGVYGRGENDGNTAYGVVGTINAASNGAGVAGSPAAWSSYYLQSKYAGFFLGDARVTGIMDVGTLVQSSDLRLKDNVSALSSRNESALDKVAGLNAVEFTYKDKLHGVVFPDSINENDVLKSIGHKSGKKHFGLIAQELQQLYPELVEELQDGYLAVNYVELVPVLIRAIQELKHELDEVKGGADETKKTRSDATAINTSSIAFTSNVLYQNTPNPFKEKTIIRFSLAPDVQNAAVCIFDMSGKMLKTLPVSPNDTSVSVNGYELGEGMFLYSLLVNGQEIDTKRMIITK